MGTMLIVVMGALCVALVTFFICEEKSLKDANLSDMKCVMEDINPAQCFEQYQTVKYLAIYFFVMLFLNLGVAKFAFIPEGFGLLEVMLYTFIPSLIGSLVILLVKWTFQPMIKLISSFLYGSVYMAASAVAFSFAYLLM
jgi:hypothetical protein